MKDRKPLVIMKYLPCVSQEVDAHGNPRVDTHGQAVNVQHGAMRTEVLKVLPKVVIITMPRVHHLPVVSRVTTPIACPLYGVDLALGFGLTQVPASLHERYDLCAVALHAPAATDPTTTSGE